MSHSEHHERHLWPGAIACIDVVPETLGIAWRVKFGSRKGGGGRVVGLGDICLRTFGERCERHLWLGAVACIDIALRHSIESQVRFANE